VKISAVVITYNEEQNIERCLRSLLFCDEIIVVDASSTDRTREIAQKFSSHVYLRSWKGYVDQKNFANSLASHDWILSIDADEEVSSELSEEIRKELSNDNPSAISAFSIARKTYHSGRWIRHGGWYPNRLVRLFRKSCGKWAGDDIHEFWSVTDGGPVVNLQEHIIHYSFKSMSDQVERNNRYSSLGAVTLSKSGRNFSRFLICVKPPLKFLETYVLKLGFLDGFPGFFISVSAAYSVFLKWAKLWEMRRIE
jgi:glycosyltransferase involved in cell wall biosynthesis